MINLWLRDYLGIVLETESNARILRSTRFKMENYIKNLGRANSFKMQNKVSVMGEFELGNAVFAAILCTLGGFFVGWVTSFRDGTSILPSVSWVWTRNGGIIGAGIGIIGYVIKAILEARRINRHIMETNRITANALAEDTKRVEMELRGESSVRRYYDIICKQLADTENLLANLYYANIIHRDYHYNIVAVATFYQYIDRGMCTTLESIPGMEGAYVLYMHESWYKELNNQQHNILDMLGKIHASQDVLINSVNHINHSINRLTQSSEMIQSYAQTTAKNSEIIAYNQERISRNTEIIAWMQFHRLM